MDPSLKELSDLTKRLIELLRPRTLPVGIKLLDEDIDKLDLPVFRPLRDFRRRITLCQAIAISRYYGWPIGLGLNDLSCPGAITIFGLHPAPDYFKDGSISAGVYTEDKELGRKLDSHIPQIPVGRVKGFATYPLTTPIANPDVILIYGTPGQMTKLVSAITYKTGEPVTLEATGKAGSCSGIAKAYLEGKPFLVLPGLGDRTIAWTQDDEMAIAIPASQYSDIVDAMAKQEETGVVTYPPRPFLFYEFKFKNIPIIGHYYDQFLKSIRGEKK